MTLTQKGSILDSNTLREELETELSKAKHNVIIISAYITQIAVDWLTEHISHNANVQLVCRLQPFDVINGSTHIPALIKMIDEGWSVSCLHSLHAKIYAIDDTLIYVGSANLTNNGLKIYGTGNLEASIQISPSQENLAFIKSVCVSATKLNKNSLHKMQTYAEEKKTNITSFQWPSNILDDQEGIWSQDFFWSRPNACNSNNEKSHDLKILGITSFDCDTAIIKENVLSARCVLWLIDILKNQENQELYFGSLTKALHNDLKDDPAPYRKNVKILIQNLLSYCTVYLENEIDISRPNHSQKIKLNKVN